MCLFRTDKTRRDEELKLEEIKFGVQGRGNGEGVDRFFCFYQPNNKR